MMKTKRQLLATGRAGGVSRIAYSVSRWRLLRNTRYGILAPGFSLIELMVVVAIMAIVMTISVPFINSAIGGGKGMTRAVKDVQEACKFARDWAILQQTPHELRIRPGDGIFEVGPAGSKGDGMHENLSRRDQYLESLAKPQDRAFSPGVDGKDWRMEGRSGSAGGKGSFSVTLPEGVVVEGLGVNGEDWTEDAVASVRFYPNGTSDEMSVVLYRPETNERRNIWLEVVTGLADIETDPAKFKAR